MAFKKLGDVIGGKISPAEVKRSLDASSGKTARTGKAPPPASAPQSSVAARDGYARAMNSGDRAGAAKYRAQMDAEEAAANVAARLKKPR